MANEELIVTLDSLHKSLLDSPKIDEQTAGKLRMLIEEIQLALVQSETENELPASKGTLTERVKTMIVDFEVHHPKLTSSLTVIAERLSDMGI